MRQIKNRRIIQRSSTRGIKNNSYYVTPVKNTEGEYPMITYKYNKETGKYEFFEAQPKNKRVTVAAIKAQQVREIQEREKLSRGVKSVDVIDTATFEEEYAAFIAQLIADKNKTKTADAVKTAPAVEEDVKETPLTQIVDNEKETVEVPTVLDEKVEEIQVKKTTKKKVTAEEE